MGIIMSRGSKNHGIYSTAVYPRGTKPGMVDTYEGIILASTAQSEKEVGSK
jgi:hypothetical protein